eukprot:TRINITY_DN76522_c0_g1_i1.p1 TRINITY_DN76522_c0_g1~~TRINITY_DN76522_c0_g1_i1.p1  ORF type:complete len:305 (-),score=49.58 TRINITY_DN76522_c0_g1_i1:86-1000(-)
MRTVLLLAICTAAVFCETSNWEVHFTNNAACSGYGTDSNPTNTNTNQHMTFVVGSEDSFPPYSSTVNNVVEGLSVDLLNAAAAAGGCSIDWVGLIWPDCLRSQYPVESSLTSSSLPWYLGPAMKQGTVDACASTGFNNARKMVITFSHPYVMGPRLSIITPTNSGVSTLSGVSSITWASGSFINNGLLNEFQAGLATDINTQSATVGGSDAALAATQAGTFEAVMIGSNEIPMSGWRVLGSIDGSPLGLAVVKGSVGKALLQCLNPGIDQIWANGLASNICNQWVAKANGVDALVPDCGVPVAN